ncbi:MAG: four helix bundle protein [Candidatus Sungbacteria bacterium]|nr:four helix bundle protein [Candidatus Sungbacteria bacterium]
MKMHFREFKVYRDAKTLVVQTFRLTRKFSREFYYLSDQINRSALSIVLNIAEGSAKGSDKDFNRYIKNSLGSATELSAAFEIAEDLRLITKEEYDTLDAEIQEVIKQLGGFSKYLRRND